MVIKTQNREKAKSSPGLPTQSHIGSELNFLIQTEDILSSSSLKALGIKR